MIYARNKPGPNPGFRANEDMSSKLIEERPAWAWDVTGRYLVTSPDFDSIINGPRTSARDDHNHDQQKKTMCSARPDFHMTIWLENNRWHSKVGRQLWAEFTFGASKGAMRLCPGTVAARLADANKKFDVQSFEEACILEPGVWPGVAPPRAAIGGKGAVEWGMRWRGYNPCMGLLDGDSGPVTLIRFSRSPDGQVSLSGTLVYGMDQITFVGHKHTAEGAERSGQAATVNTTWRRFQPRALSLMDFMDFEEPE